MLINKNQFFWCLVRQKNEHSYCYHIHNSKKTYALSILFRLSKYPCKPFNING